MRKPLVVYIIFRLTFVAVVEIAGAAENLRVRQYSIVCTEIKVRQRCPCGTRTADTNLYASSLLRYDRYGRYEAHESARAPTPCTPPQAWSNCKLLRYGSAVFVLLGALMRDLHTVWAVCEFTARVTVRTALVLVFDFVATFVMKDTS